MRSKEEQRQLSYERIDAQAEELINVYGWNERDVRIGKAELRGRVWDEVENFGDYEDVVDCWSLVHRMSQLKVCLSHDFSRIEDYKAKIEMRRLAYDIVDKFIYVEDAKYDEVKIVAFADENGSGVLVFVYDDNENYIYLPYENIQKGINKLGVFGAVQRIYKEIQRRRMNPS